GAGRRRRGEVGRGRGARASGATSGRAHRRLRGRGQAARRQRTARRVGGASDRGVAASRAGGRPRPGRPDPGTAASTGSPPRSPREQAPADGRLGEPHCHREGGVAAGRGGPDERRRGPAAVHLPAHRQHPPPPRVRQAGRAQPRRTPRLRASLDRVMSAPYPAHTINGAAVTHAVGPDHREGATVDHAATMRKTYELINAGDIDTFGDLLAADFVEHQGGPGYPPTKEGTLDFFRDLLGAFPDWHMAVQDLIAGSDKTVARVRVSGTQSGEFIG